ARLRPGNHVEADPVGARGGRRRGRLRRVPEGDQVPGEQAGGPQAAGRVEPFAGGPAEQGRRPRTTRAMLRRAPEAGHELTRQSLDAHLRVGVDAEIVVAAVSPDPYQQLHGPTSGDGAGASSV